MFFKLVKNEFNKQFKKKTVLAMAILSISTSIIAPVILKHNNEKSINETSYVETQRSIEIYREELSKSIEDNKDQIHYINSQVELEYYELTEVIKIETFDWRRQLINDYKTNLNNLRFMEAIKEGLNIDDILRYGTNFDVELIESLDGADTQDLDQGILHYQEKCSLYYQILLENDYVGGIGLFIQQIDDEIQDEMIKIQKVDMDETIEEVEKEASIATYLHNIKIYNLNKSLYQYRLDNEIYFDKSDWRNQTLIELIGMHSKLNGQVISEKEFYRYPDGKYDDYEQYVAITTKLNGQRQERVDLLWYSLETNTPLMDVEYDARIVTILTTEISIILVTLFIVFIGSGIISGEFSRGTVRMLMSRSTSRSQIFLSKLIMLLCTGFIMIIMCCILSWITSGILYNFQSLFMPIAQVKDGIIYQESFFSYLVLEVGPSTGGLIAIIGLQLMLSTVTKSTVITVGTNLVLYIIAPLLSAVLASQNFILYTIFPYLNGGALKWIEDFRNSFWGMGIDLNLDVGFFGMVVLSMLCTSIGYIFFIKQDVRN